jgi:Transglycosylase SLT domain
MRRGTWFGGFWGAIASLLLGSTYGYAAEASSKKPRWTIEAVKKVIEKTGNNVQLVTFPETDSSPVNIVRGSKPLKGKDAQKEEIAEIVAFGDPQNNPVRVMRGDTDRAMTMPRQPRGTNGIKMELATFDDPRNRPVSILRGPVAQVPDIALFDPASFADLDRVSFAVDGAESSHGADLTMWRSETSGPQGPMQVTAAAAIDVGGGNRFDIGENRTLGRAYLARMYRRYGNWPDAITAYNWGPGNVDLWISGGRAADKVPLGVERCRERVLRDAALAGGSSVFLSRGWPFGSAAAGAPGDRALIPASTVAASTPGFGPSPARLGRR